MVCRACDPGTSSYCYLLLCYMNGNAVNFCGVIFIIEGVVLLLLLVEMIIPSYRVCRVRL